MELRDASLYVWHRVRDQIAEGVPGFVELSGIEVAEMCWALLEHYWQCPDCSWQHLDKVCDEYRQDGTCP